MSRLVLAAVVASAFVLSACGKKVITNRYQSDQFAVSLQRGAQNQASIRVTKAPRGEADLALVEMQGYVEAYDRFQQMDLARRAAEGRLAELFGTKALPRDLEAVGAGLRLAVERDYERVKKESQEAVLLLQAYADGVNRYLANLDGENADLLRWYRATTRSSDYVPDPWKPEDSLAVAVSISFYLSSSLKEKLALGKIAGDVTQGDFRAAFSELFDFRPIERVFILDQAKSPTAPPPRATPAPRPTPPGPGTRPNPGAGHVPPPGPTGLHLPTSRRATGVALPPRELFAVGGECQDLGFPFPECARKTSMGSNSWVLSPAFSGDGSAILANDPHLAITFPMTMYEIALDSQAGGGTFRTRGYNLAGVPGVLIGHNDHIAWGFTNFPADVDDVYIELANDSGTSVLFRGNQVPIESRPADIRVRQANGELAELTDAAGKPMQLRIVPHHGPVFSDFAPETRSGLAQLEPKLRDRTGINFKPLLTYRWTGHEGTGELVALLGVNRARSFDEFKKALQTYEAGAQNMIYMDRQGNIGYYAHGKYPVRPGASRDWPPFLPQLGAGDMPTLGARDAEWNGYRATMPEMYNPALGRIVTANNDPYGETAKKGFGDYKDYLGYGFSTGIRAKRISDLLDATKKQKGKVTFDDVERIQSDHLDLLVVRFLEILADNKDRFNEGNELSDAASKLVKRLVEDNGTLKFDGVMARDRQEPVIADAWLSELRDEWFKELKSSGRFSEGGLGATVMAKTLYHKIFDAVTAFNDEKVIETMKASLENTVKRLDSRGQAGARWGQVHTVTFANPFEGLVPSPVSFPMERDGSWETVDAAGQTLGPNFRLVMVARPGQPIEAYTAVPGGNFPPKETAQWQGELLLWRDGRHRPLVGY